MLSPAQGRKQRQELMRDIARDQRRKQHEELRALVVALREARAARREAIRETKAACREGRKLARERVKELRLRALAELRESVLAERTRAREACSAGRAAARELGTRAEQARAKLAAERQFRREMRRIERGNRERRRELAPRRAVGERASESDDEVRGSLPHELVPLFERVKRGIKATPHMSRLEHFLLYAENHPGEALESMEDRTEILVRELEAKERAAARALARRPTSRRRTPVLEEAPF
jgi:hypothetical protein